MHPSRGSGSRASFQLARGPGGPAWALALAAGLLLAGSDRAAHAAPATPAPAVSQEGRRILVLLRLPPSHYRPGGDAGGAYDDSLGHTARLRVAARLARAHGLTLVTDWPMPLLGVDCYVLEAPAGRSIQAEADSLCTWRGPQPGGRASTHHPHRHHARESGLSR